MLDAVTRDEASIRFFPFTLDVISTHTDLVNIITMEILEINVNKVNTSKSAVGCCLPSVETRILHWVYWKYNNVDSIVPPLDLPRVKKKENDKDEDVKEEEREPKDRRCFQCGDMGHVRRDCPEFRHLKQRPPGVPGSARTVYEH